MNTTIVNARHLVNNTADLEALAHLEQAHPYAGTVNNIASAVRLINRGLIEKLDPRLITYTDGLYKITATGREAYRIAARVTALLTPDVQNGAT